MYCFTVGPGLWENNRWNNSNISFHLITFLPGRVIPKTQKMVLDASSLNTKQFKEGIKGKWSNPGNGVAPSPTLQCSSY